jgi:hypothetical protein
VSAFSSAWGELYSAQTDAVGAALTATVGTVAVSKRCIATESPFAKEFPPDGGGETWGADRTLQMLASDFTATPEENMSVTVSDDSRTFDLLDFNLNNGVYYLRLGQSASA